MVNRSECIRTESIIEIVSISVDLMLVREYHYLHHWVFQRATLQSDRLFFVDRNTVKLIQYRRLLLQLRRETTAEIDEKTKLVRCEDE